MTSTLTLPRLISEDRAATPVQRSPFTRVCRTDDLERSWGVAALVGDTQIALFRMPSGDVYAVDNADPKTGAMVLARGIVGSKLIDGEHVPVIASPLHKDTFDLRTGRCLTSPDLHLKTHRVHVVDGDVYVAPAPALLAISHGTSDPRGHTAVAALVEAVTNAVPGVSTLGGHVDVEQPDLPTTLAAAAGDAVIVPLLLATGYHVKHDIADAVGEQRATGAGAPDTRVTAALGPDGRLATVTARRLAEIEFDPRRDAVVLAVAGSSDPGAVEDGDIAGALLADALGAEVAVGALAGHGPPLTEVIQATRAAHPDRRIVAASYLLAPGYFHALAERAGADVTTRPLLVANEAPANELVAIVRDRYLGALPVRRC